MTLSDLFTKVEAFVAAAETGTGDLMDKGSAWLRSLADYVDAQKAALKGCGPDECAPAVALLARCKACCPDTCDPHAPKKAAGPFVTLLFSLLTTFLEKLLAQQPAPA